MSPVTAFPLADTLARLQSGLPLPLVAAEEVRPEDTERYPALCLLLAAAEQVHLSRQQISQVADLLRRDQKFARPGPPSPHLVQLRKQQAAARQAANQAQLAYVQAAKALVNRWPLQPPAGVSIESFVAQWLARHLPPVGATD